MSKIITVSRQFGSSGLSFKKIAPLIAGYAKSWLEENDRKDEKL